MYMVISQWKAKSPDLESTIRGGSAPRQFLRSQPGCKLCEVIFDGDTAHVVHAYESEADYDRIVNDPDGGFAKALKESGIENHAEWVGSVRGNTIED